MIKLLINKRQEFGLTSTLKTETFSIWKEANVFFRRVISWVCSRKTNDFNINNVQPFFRNLTLNDCATQQMIRVKETKIFPFFSSNFHFSSLSLNFWFLFLCKNYLKRKYFWQLLKKMDSFAIFIKIPFLYIFIFNNKKLGMHVCIACKPLKVIHNMQNEYFWKFGV